MEHSLGYAQSVAEKQLSRNLMYSLLDIPNNAKVFKNVNNKFHISWSSLSSFCIHLHQHIKYLNNSFWPILCTYPGECSMCVPQDCLCDTSVLVKTVWIDWFGYIRTTASYYVAVSVGPSFIHIRLTHTSRTNISISWNLRYSWIEFCQYHLVQIWL